MACQSTLSQQRIPGSRTLAVVLRLAKQRKLPVLPVCRPLPTGQLCAVCCDWIRPDCDRPVAAL